MNSIRTVLGDVDPAALGVVDSHDHLFFRSPLLPGHELDDPDLALAEVRAFAAAGGSTIVSWTPRGLGRQRDRLVEIARQTGVHIVSATGRHRAEHYDTSAGDVAVEALAAAFVDDILAAAAPCGLIKIGTGFHHLDRWEASSLDAAVLAHHATGVPIAVHLEAGTGADLVVERLRVGGVPPTSIILGHVGRNPDEYALLELADAGTYLCFDGPSRAHHHTDWRTLACIETLVAGGFVEQLLIGGDTTSAGARSVTSGPGMPGLLTRFGNELRRGIGVDAYRAIAVTNAARAFTLRGTNLAR